MIELDDRTRRDLARLRDRGAPSHTTKQRMYAALEARLDPGGGDDPGDDPGGEAGGDPGGGDLVWIGKVVGATAGMTAGGLLAVRVVAELVRALGGAPQQPESNASTQAQPVELVATSVEAESTAPAPAPSEPSEPSEPQRPPTRTKPTTPSQPATQHEDTLAAELALLEAAHAASDPAAALIELERHLARFPGGELAGERELLRIEALCQLGRLREAGSLRDSFARSQPSAALKKRLVSACPALDASQKN